MDRGNRTITANNKDQPDRATQFVAALDELAEFNDYFTDDAKVQQLVDWLHTETGINKIALRLAVRRVAPFVVARLASLGKAVGKAWMTRLNERLGRFDWYFNLTQTLLKVLRTRTSGALDEALSIPANENLEVLIRNRELWNRLTPEQQGVVQLLLGQNQLSEGQDVLLRQLDDIIRKLAFDLDLKSPDSIIREAKNAEKGSAHWLTYAARQAALTGRKPALEQLDDFFDHADHFRWWTITGSGGVGKSRLALEALLRRPFCWEVGFLRAEKLSAPDALANWQPSGPTVIVIDYAQDHAEQIGRWVDHFIQHENDYAFPLRLLLLEREHRQQAWWETLLPSTTAGFSRKQRLHEGEPYRLEPLGKSDLREALRGFLDALNSQATLPEPDDDFWQSLHDLTDKGRPLFIGMVAIAITDRGLPATRQWRREDLLEYLLKREQQTWQRQLEQAGFRNPTEQDRVLRLLALNTFTGGIDWRADDTWEHLLVDWLASDEDTLARMQQSLPTLTGHASGILQPDLFAEYVLLQLWNSQTPGPALRLAERAIKAGHRIAPENSLTFIGRAAIDYPENRTARQWWRWLAEDDTLPDRTPLFEQAMNIVGTLRLHGRYQLALQQWLPLLQDINAPGFRARVLNMQGMLHHHLSNLDDALPLFEQALAIRQEIGDKAGEGTTLNNISQIYDARGDYDAALKFLEQSLAIRQEIGDKAGEGTTLNNISQIYHARGDYDSALEFLEQSLTIRQEIGDKAGEGATLNNISQIYDARGDYDAALKFLEQSLAISQEIGDKAGEGTTLNNISQIYHARGDYDSALEFLEQSLAIRQEIGDKAGEGTTLNNISQIYKARGDYDAALEFLEQSLAIRQEIGDKAGEGATLNNISQIYKARGDYDAALKFLEQSLAIRQEIGDKAGEGTTLNNISQIYKARGDYDAALKFLEQSLAISQEIGDKAGEGATLNNMATTAHIRGDYDAALEFLEQSLAICQEIGDKAGEGATLNNMATTAHIRGDYDSALEFLEQSLAIRREIGDKAGEGTTLNNISQIYKARGDYDSALKFLEQSLAIRREIGDTAGLCATLFNMGHIHLQNEQMEEAIGAWVTVYQLARPMQLAQALEALEGLAEQLGLPGGLEAWDRLAQKLGVDRVEAK